MSSAAQLEAKIATGRGRGYLEKIINPVFFFKYKVENLITRRTELQTPVNLVFLYILVF